MSSEISHIAFSDESSHNTGRYRGIALVSMKHSHVDSVRKHLAHKLKESNVEEFCWERLRTAKYRHAALKIIDVALRCALNGTIRIDVLTWDTADARHSIRGRDDVANLERMYHHLFVNVLKNKWPSKTVWKLHPDENTAINWDAVHAHLDRKRIEIDFDDSQLMPEDLRLVLKHEFGLHEIVQVKSHEEPLVQLADFFVGIGTFSRTSYDMFESWRLDEEDKQSLFPANPRQINLSSSDPDRFFVMNEFNKKCKSNKLQISLKSHGGFKSKNPQKPINFWWYEPQHKADKAPIRTI